MKNILIILLIGFTLLFNGCSETEIGLYNDSKISNERENDIKTYANTRPLTQNRGILKENMIMENKAYSATRGR